MSETYSHAPPYASRVTPEMLHFTAQQWRRLFSLASREHCPPFHWRWLYDTYMASNAWKAKQFARRERDAQKCSECGVGWPLEVHHLHYRTIGDEDVAHDLKTLCERCHIDHHAGMPAFMKQVFPIQRRVPAAPVSRANRYVAGR